MKQSTADEIKVLLSKYRRKFLFDCGFSDFEDEVQALVVEDECICMKQTHLNGICQKCGKDNNHLFVAWRNKIETDNEIALRLREAIGMLVIRHAQQPEGTIKSVMQGRLFGYRDALKWLTSQKEGN